ncbi:trans-2,3-dihydro-3-hydroxyanthranilate isomerase [Tranquillimonas rosea]|uniref:Trans-2,3-dihydro-3-hydroxyanthranilate isomerase n=1 Tax=Tranquillimonas rosea TaxID=641238 RepID=A0A1H9THP1_9RHOB|nr:PhzF family phenazine biosynthesis protein [Tranquillimonas rosea]SER96369.1 trans-2,3-dihydro-3-hydroxyanthranilate isomerase [Tranquillimonas rosea]
MTRYFVYDVFTDMPFGGNPLAVIPDASGLAEDRLQRIAREFNFSETTFVYPADEPGHTAKVRIFTPTTEIPFAGHPTIGTAIALDDLGHGGEQVLELGVGPITCRVRDGAADFVTHAPLEILFEPAPEDIAACLGLPEGAIRTDRHAPAVASVGLPFVLAELDSAETLAACLPVTDAFRRAAQLYPSDFDFAILAYVRDGEAVRARMFAPLDNIPEDPATGSAAAALGAYLAQREGGELTLDIAQGVEMGRPSRIGVRVAEGAVTITGRAVQVMEGRITL